ncbi:MAG: nucleotidyltransferase domain-containing protein [Chlamydiae bacterium]|nr:nucleotidyltransferase domain-containing protein [Chlamydiota bacterium]
MKIIAVMKQIRIQDLITFLNNLSFSFIMRKKERVFSLGNLQNLVKEFFQKKDQVISVQIFGSFAKGSNTVDSDVDLAILCDVKNMPSKMDLLSWRQELSELLRKEVDLICLNEASPILGMQVAQDRINILLKDEKAYSAYVMNLYSDYAELKMLRAPMEQGILKRKYYDQ